MLRRHNRSCILGCNPLNDDHACVPSPRTWSKAYGRSPWDDLLSSFRSHAPTTSPRCKCIFLVDAISCIFLYFNPCCLSHFKYVINLNSFSVVTWTWTWTWNSRDCSKPESDVECIIQVNGPWGPELCGFKLLCFSEIFHRQLIGLSSPSSSSPVEDVGRSMSWTSSLTCQSDARTARAPAHRKARAMSITPSVLTCPRPVEQQLRNRSFARSLRVASCTSFTERMFSLEASNFFGAIQMRQLRFHTF